MRFVLPFPPSLSHYYRQKRGAGGGGERVMSVAGRKWRRAAIDNIRVSGPIRTMTERVSLRLILCPPDRQKRDLDNYCKAVQDALMKARVIEDDSQIDRLVVERGEVGKPGSVEVILMQHGTPGA